MQEIITFQEILANNPVQYGFFWTFVINLAINLALTAIMARMNKPDAPGRGKFQESSVPTASAEKNVPVIFGTVMFRSPNVLWYGSNRSTKIKKGGGLFTSSKVVGYKYYLSYATALCMAVDKQPVIIRKIIANDDKVLRDLDKTVESINFNSEGVFIGDLQNSIDFTVDYQENETTIYKPRVFGSEGEDNGYIGEFQIHNGTQTTNSSFLDSKVGNIPPYKDLCYIVFKDNYIGNQNSLPTISFETSHFPIPHWGTEDEGIINFFDYNPVYALYYILTDDKIGADIPEEMIDIDNFKEAAAVLKQEGLGISMEISTKINFDQFKQTFEDTISGTFDLDYGTGKFKVRLTRPDYDVNNLPVLTENEISNLSWDKQTINGTISEYKVSFEDRENNYKPSVATASDTGMRFNKKSISSVSTEFSWVKNSGLASKIAARELKPLSYTLIKCNFNLSQAYIDLSRGDVIKLEYGPDNLNIVMRVMNIDYGNFDNNNVKVSCVEDLFGNFDYSYSPNIPPVTTSTNNTLPANFLPVELPYFRNRTEEGGSVLVACERPNGEHTYYDVVRQLDTNLYRTVSTSEFFYTPEITQPSGAFDNTLYFEDFEGKENLESKTTNQMKKGENLLIIADNAGNYEFASFSNAVLNVGGDKNVNYLTGLKRGLFHGFMDLTNLDNSPIIIFEDYADRTDFELIPYNVADTYLSRTKTNTNIQEIRNCFSDFFNHNRELSLTNYTPSNLSVNGNTGPTSIDYPLDYSSDQITKEYGFILNNGDQGKDLYAPLDFRIFYNEDSNQTNSFEGYGNEENLCELIVKDPNTNTETLVFNGLYRQRTYIERSAYSNQNYISGYLNQFLPLINPDASDDFLRNLSLVYLDNSDPITDLNETIVYKGHEYDSYYGYNNTINYINADKIMFLPIIRYYYNYITKIDQYGNCYIRNGYVKMPNTIVKVKETINEGTVDEEQIEYYADYKTDSHVRSLIDDKLANIENFVNSYDSQNDTYRKTFLYLDQTETVYETFTDYFNALIKFTCDLEEPKFIDYEEEIIHITSLLNRFNGASVFDENNIFSPKPNVNGGKEKYRPIYYDSQFNFWNNTFGNSSENSHDFYYDEVDLKQKIFTTWEEIEKGEPELNEFFYINDQPHIVDDFSNSLNIDYQAYYESSRTTGTIVRVNEERKRDFSLLNSYTLTPVDVVRIQWSTDDKRKEKIKFWNEAETPVEEKISECSLKVYEGASNLVNAYLYDEGNFTYDFVLEPDVNNIRIEIIDHTSYTQNSQDSETLTWYVNINRT